jgi:hypothetical protein
MLCLCNHFFKKLRIGTRIVFLYEVFHKAIKINNAINFPEVAGACII